MKINKIVPIIPKIILLILFCSGVISCSSNYKIEQGLGELLIEQNIEGVIGVKIFSYEKPGNYVFRNGKIYKSKTLPEPPIPSHQNPELSGDNYNFLPQTIEYKYVGPELISPDGTITVASCINKNKPLHAADTFVLIENKRNKIIYKEAMDKHFSIEGIAWSPKSDIFIILTSRSRDVIQWNILRYIAGHPVNSSDYYLFFYKKDGQSLFKKRFISSMSDAYAQIVWGDFGDIIINENGNTKN
jgi:hypothetical protein